MERVMSNSCQSCKALWVKFRLTSSLSKYTGSATAKVYTDIAANRHFWQGEDPDPDDEGFNVYNLEATQSSYFTYQFDGSVNDVGIACLDDSNPDVPIYRIVYIGTYEQSVVAQLSSNLTAWDNTEFVPNCQTIGGTIVSACGATQSTGNPINIIFLNVPGKSPAVGTGDWVGCSPVNLTASPPLYIACTDYTIRGVNLVYWGYVKSDVLEWAESGCTQVQVLTQDNCDSDGEDPNGQTVNVVLPKVEGKRPNLHVGDVVAFTRVTDNSGDNQEYVCVSDYAISTEHSVIVKLTSTPAQWPNGESFMPGCQTVTGTVVAKCGSDGGDWAGKMVHVVLPNVRNRLVAVESGDYVSAVLLKEASTYPAFAITSDYTRIEYDCGLSFDEGSATLKVDADKLAGAGLTKEEGEDCSITIDKGCGVILTEGKVNVNNIDLVGPGLKAGSYCTLAVNPGCGLAVDSEQVYFKASSVAGRGLLADQEGGCELEVDAGCGLTFSGNQLQVDVDKLAGPGLQEYGLCSLKPKLGCGLRINGSSEIEVFSTSLAGPGLHADDATCSMEVLTGCGLRVNGSNEVEVYPGTTYEYKISYVKDVSLVDGNLSVTKGCMEFSSCGLFIRDYICNDDTSTTGTSTTTSGPTSTTPNVTSTTAGVTSTTPYATSTTAGVTSTTPYATSTTAGVTSTTPYATSTTAGVTSTTPSVSSTTPGLTSTTSDVTSTTFAPTSTTPNVSPTTESLATTTPIP